MRNLVIAGVAALALASLVSSEAVAARHPAIHALRAARHPSVPSGPAKAKGWWTCYAVGKVGTPGGAGGATDWGQPTRAQAARLALQECRARGVRDCKIWKCYNKAK